MAHPAREQEKSGGVKALKADSQSAGFGRRIMNPAGEQGKSGGVKALKADSQSAGLETPD